MKQKILQYSDPRTLLKYAAKVYSVFDFVMIQVGCVVRHGIGGGMGECQSNERNAEVSRRRNT